MNREIATKKKNGSDQPYLRFIQQPNQILVMQWKGFVKADLIKEGHEDALRYIQQYQFKGIVEDVVDFSGPFTEVNEWFIQYWVPQALQRGLKKAAVLMNKNLFTQLSVEALKENPAFKQLGLGYRIFGELEEALSWLEHQDQVVVDQ